MVINPIVGVYIPSIRIPIKRWDDHPQYCDFWRWHISYQQIFEVLGKVGSVAYNHPICSIHRLYTRYILPARVMYLYTPHHLLPEPEKSIDHMYISGPPPSQQTYVSYKNSGIYRVSRTFGPLDFVAAPACSGIVPEPFCNGKNWQTEKLNPYGESLPGCLRKKQFCRFSVCCCSGLFRNSSGTFL